MGSPKCQGKIAIHESQVTVFDWIQLWGCWTGCKFITLQLREVLTGKPRLHQESALVPTLLYLSWMLSLAASMSLAAAAGHAREWELHSKCCLFICLEIWKSKEAKAGKTQVCGLQTTVTPPKPSSLQGKARHVLRHQSGQHQVCDLLLSKPKLYLLDFRVEGMTENSALVPVTYVYGLFSQNKTWNLVQNRKNTSLISGFNLKRILGTKSAPTAPWLLSQVLNRGKDYNSWLQPLMGNIFLEETLKGLPRKTA